MVLSLTSFIDVVVFVVVVVIVVIIVAIKPHLSTTSLLSPRAAGGYIQPAPPTPLPRRDDNDNDDNLVQYDVLRPGDDELLGLGRRSHL